MRRKSPKPTRPPSTPSLSRLQATLNAPVIHALAASVIAIIAYVSSFQGKFVFDDYPGIVDNPLIRQVFPLGRFLDSSRPLVDLSLAFNFAAGALDPWGYHLVNLLIHLSATLTLYGIVRRTLTANKVPDASPGSSARLAFTIAVIWAVHPLQTESVTYLIQRSEAMMGLFYLLTLYCALRGMQSTRGAPWYIAATVACVAGMASKAVMVTAPVVVLLYDRCFMAGSFIAAFQKRRKLYGGLASTWLVLVAFGVVRGVMDTPQAEPPTVGFGYKGVTPMEYLQTQSGVILHYLKLSFWPVGLCLDYGWPVAKTPWQIAGPAVVIGILIIASLWAFWRRRAAGFLGLAFFLVLLPTSSFVPIKDLAFEHRMYLPLAAVVTLISIGSWKLASLRAAWRKPAVAIAGLVVVALCTLTVLRNRIYADPVALWQDTVVKAPHHPRPHNALGYALLSRGDVAGAMAKFEDALRLDRGYAGAYANMGEACVRERRYDDAVLAFQTALEIDPDILNARAHFHYGAALLELRRLDQAIEEFKASLSLDRRQADAYYFLATTLRLAGQRESAAAVYRQALDARPRYIEAMVDLGLTLAELGRFQEAVVIYQKAISMSPADKRNVQIKAHYNFGIALRSLQRPQEAAGAFRAALSLDPNHAGAKAALDALQTAPN